ncbi:ABC transporter substrate-binding protein [Paenibacillus sp. Soil766]|uniref:ABC transporter substrate-binding protein n=1 Tax=Paenibacillus sp. Soil766 TaxID=1736404 RepID=UPI00070E8336|nr:ABC transporter substrate-binding protein [Paenibacillus sp. Soil766]KRF03341.1 ABC transporter substrate-binding protein [Paenibacillus sp. Soil766]
MKKISLIVLSILLVVILAACGANNNNSSSDNTSSISKSSGTSSVTDASQSASTSAENAKRTLYPLTETDATGKKITFVKAPEKIVSTSPSETEILFALGLADRIVGVSKSDNFPKEVESKAKIGSTTTPNAEAIVATGADLVVTGISIKDTALENLRTLGLNVICSDPKNLNDVLNEILFLGRITDKQKEAEALVAQMKADIKKVTDVAATIKLEKKKKVYIEFSPGWTVGSGEFMNELITLSGGLNIASDVKGWIQIDEEKIIKDNPDVIIYTLDKVDKEGKKLEDLIHGRTGWRDITAIKTEQVIGLNGDVLSRPGPRITQALLGIANAIYPDLYKK